MEYILCDGCNNWHHMKIEKCIDGTSVCINKRHWHHVNKCDRCRIKFCDDDLIKCILCNKFTCTLKCKPNYICCEITYCKSCNKMNNTNGHIPIIAEDKCPHCKHPNTSKLCTRCNRQMCNFGRYQCIDCLDYHCKKCFDMYVCNKGLVCSTCKINHDDAEIAMSDIWN